MNRAANQARMRQRRPAQFGLIPMTWRSARVRVIPWTPAASDRPEEFDLMSWNARGVPPARSPRGPVRAPEGPSVRASDLV